MRGNFIVAAHLVSALHSSVFARLASGAFYETIVPVKTGVYGVYKYLKLLDSGFRRNTEKPHFQSFCEFIKIRENKERFSLSQLRMGIKRREKVLNGKILLPVGRLGCRLKGEFDD